MTENLEVCNKLLAAQNECITNQETYLKYLVLFAGITCFMLFILSTRGNNSDEVGKTILNSQRDSLQEVNSNITAITQNNAELSLEIKTVLESLDKSSLDIVRRLNMINDKISSNSGNNVTMTSVSDRPSLDSIFDEGNIILNSVVENNYTTFKTIFIFLENMF